MPGRERWPLRVGLGLESRLSDPVFPAGDARCCIGWQVREISNDEGNRLLRSVCRYSGSVVTWRRAQMVLLSAQGMDVPQIAKVTFTSSDRVRDVVGTAPG